MLCLCVCVIHLAHRQCHSCYWQLSHHIDDNSSGPGSEILLFHSFPGLPVVGKAACGEVRAPLFVLPCFHSRIPWMTTIQIYPSISGGQHEIFALIGNWHFVGAGTRSNIPIHKTSRRGQWEPNFVINHFLIWHFELFRFPFSAANSHGRLLPRCSWLLPPPLAHSLSVLPCVGAFHAPLKFNRKSIFVANENSNNKIPTAAKTSSMFFSSSLSSPFVAQVRYTPPAPGAMGIKCSQCNWQRAKLFVVHLQQSLRLNAQLNQI